MGASGAPFRLLCTAAWISRGTSGKSHTARSPRQPSRARMRFRWLAGDMKRAWEAMMSKDHYGWRVAAQAFDGGARTKDSIWSWSDPWPAVQEFIFAAGALGLMAVGAMARA